MESRADLRVLRLPQISLLLESGDRDPYSAAAEVPGASEVGWFSGGWLGAPPRSPRNHAIVQGFPELRYKPERPQVGHKRYGFTTKLHGRSEVTAELKRLGFVAVCTRRKQHLHMTRGGGDGKQQSP